MITAIFAGMVSLLTVISAIASQRAGRIGASRTELRELREYAKIADAWIFKLESGYTRKGLTIPRGKPKELTDDGDHTDDGDDTKALAPRA